MTAHVLDRPIPGPLAAWAFPEPQQHQLPNGMQLLTVHLPGQHVLALRVMLLAPLSQEQPGSEGSTLLMAHALDEGTNRHTAEQLAARAEQHGINFGAGVGERGVHLSADFTSRHLGLALEHLTECLAEPVFPSTEVNRLVRHRLADLAHERAHPPARVAREFSQTYYRDHDRARLPAGGTPHTVATLNAEQLRDRHRQLGPRGGIVVLAGDFTAAGGNATAARAVTSTIGSWPGTAGSPGTPPQPAPARRAENAGRIVLVASPGLEQSELYLGRPGPDRHTQHGWASYQTLGMVLGGSPHARIDQVLREQRGYTYGIRVGFRPRASGGITVVSGSVRADVTPAAVAELIQILSLSGSDLEVAEVRAAAGFLALTAPGRYGTADAVADELLSLVSDQLPVDTVTRTLQQLPALELDQVASAWDEVADGPGWTLTLVGDPAYATGLEQAGLGPVAVLED